MPKSRVNVSVQQKGAIFNAAVSKAAAARMVVNINDKLAQEGVNRVKTYLKKVLQNPTGYYESRIAVDRRQVYRGISDSGVVYGGWLEGVDSRNKTTRFKGYRTFRYVMQGMQQDKVKLAQPLVNKFISEMNG